MSATLLVEEWRGPIVECEYWGHLCGIDTLGNIRYELGNPYFSTYLRSAAKPFQALSFFARGLHRRYGLTSQEQAILTASHRAQSFHMDTLETLLIKLDLKEEYLVCGATYPLHGPTKNKLVCEHKPERKLYHNCSGKHLAMLAVCKEEGYPMIGYEDPSHPLQREIVETVARFSEYDANQIQIGLDGCGLPVLGLPIYHMAKAFMKLSRPELITDNVEMRQAVLDLTTMMHQCPEYVSGTDLICPVLLKDPNIVAKGGAKGIYCFALRNEGLAFALKVLDGSEEKWPFIVASVLEQIQYPNRQTIEQLLELCPVDILNSIETRVGKHRAAFQL